MSVYEKCLGCDPADLSLDELLKSLFVTDSEGNTGIEIKLNVCSSENTSAITCADSAKTLKELIVESLVIDECGKCSLKAFVDLAEILQTICDYCDQR